MATISEYVERALALQPQLERRREGRASGEGAVTWRALTEAEADAREAAVADVSNCGLALVIDQPIRRGTLLVVEQRNPVERRPLLLHVLDAPWSGWTVAG